MLFVDLDDFKTINDTLGHGAGDDLLVAVAERVRACVRPGDLAARLGGDEFGILLESAADDAAEQIASRLVEALRAPFVLNGREMQVHASIGIASGLYGARTADELLRNADVAMYNAKAGGRQRYAIYEPHMHTHVRRRHELGAALEHAIDRDEITVHFQPIVTLSGARTVAFEALARWQHPTRGLVLPGGFIPLAEERGLMVRIGQTVLREACSRAKEWQTKFPAHASLERSGQPVTERAAEPPADPRGRGGARGDRPRAPVTDRRDHGKRRDGGSRGQIERFVHFEVVRVAVDERDLSVERLGQRAQRVDVRPGSASKSCGFDSVLLVVEVRIRLPDRS